MIIARGEMLKTGQSIFSAEQSSNLGAERHSETTVESVVAHMKCRAECPSEAHVKCKCPNCGTGGCELTELSETSRNIRGATLFLSKNATRKLLHKFGSDTDRN